MAKEKELDIYLYSNDKGDNENRPDIRGSVKVNGELYWVSLWRGKGKDKKGRAYMTGEGEKAEPQNNTYGTQQEASGGANLNDDIPF